MAELSCIVEFEEEEGVIVVVVAIEIRMKRLVIIVLIASKDKKILTINEELVNEDENNTKELKITTILVEEKVSMFGVSKEIIVEIEVEGELVKLTI